MTINEDPSPNLIGRQVDRSTSRQVDRSTSRQFGFGSLGYISHHALSPCTSSWTIPTYPFIYFGNIDLSTCRLVDLSTCRPSAIVNKKDPVRFMVRLGLVLAILALLICRLVDLSTCRPVDLSTCRPSAIVNYKDPVRVRVRLGLVLGLVCG